MESVEESASIFSGSVALYECGRQPPSEVLLCKDYKGEYWHSQLTESGLGHLQ